MTVVVSLATKGKIYNNKNKVNHNTEKNQQYRPKFSGIATSRLYM